METKLGIFSGEMTFDEACAVMRGKDLQEYRKKKELRHRIDSESQKYMLAPVSDWPTIKINWDVSINSQRFSLDGVSLEDFQKFYPQGFCLGWVALDAFDRILCHFSRRDDGELWKVGFQSRLAYLIVYLSEGRPISPPLAKPLPSKEIILCGGHHRYAIAKAIGESEIPIHVDPEHKEEFDSLIKVKWI